MTTPTTQDQARELANLLGRPNEPHRTRYREAIESLAAQVEALTAERDAAVEAGHTAVEMLDKLLIERDSLMAELDKLKLKDKFVSEQATVLVIALDKIADAHKFNCAALAPTEVHSLAFVALTEYTASLDVEGAQPAEIEALRADAARYAAKRKEIFLKRNMMQVSGPRSTEEEFNSEYDANCDKAIKGYVADHRGVLVFNSAMVAAKAAS